MARVKENFFVPHPGVFHAAGKGKSKNITQNTNFPIALLANEIVN